jgi:murein L,D-transpeptidase YcbB/YkuD
MRVIVGKTRQPTPVFTEKMRYLIVNPYWNVPTTVAIRDLIPKQLSNPDFFQSRSIRVLSGWQPGAVEVDPDQVNWQDYLIGDYLPYKLRQDPGPQNALGRIKFMLPNRFSIYLHDTPGRQLFNKPVRTFSAGCVRVEKPMALANYVLGTQQPSAQALLEEVIDLEETRTLSLPDPIQVYLLYQTAWVGEGGTLQFRNDIYGHDRRLAAALSQAIAPEKGDIYAGNLSIGDLAGFLQ